MSDRCGDLVQMVPVAVLRSPFGEKFGIPRQAGLAPSVRAEVQFLAPYDDPEMLRGLAGFSHVWLTFRFHRCVAGGWRPRVRPPRLGGNAEVGVWASRAPFRPNFIGLSAVRLDEVVEYPRPMLRVSGVDLLDGTPVLDIRPYVPYADALFDATGGFAETAPARIHSVLFSRAAQAQLAVLPDSARLIKMIEEVLSLDPRPAYRKSAEPERIYGMRLAGLDLRWRVLETGVEVVELAVE